MAEEPELDDDITKEFNKAGFAGVSRFLSDKLDTWKNTPLKIAVIGKTKSGKSSFINAIRGLSPQDKGAAKVGVCQVTTKTKEYPSPDNPNLIYVDVPGVGTPSFPQETYLEVVNIDQFDFFIILSCDTFTEYDDWLVSEIKRRGKSFLFIRTKIDIDLRSQEEDFKDSFSEKETLEMIKKNCKDNIKNTEDRFIYLISNKQMSKWDFPSVRETLVKDFPERKHDALVLSLGLVIGDTRNMIMMKEKALQRRIVKLSLASAAAGAVPIPGISAVVDIPMLLKEIFLYRRQLGLDSESVEKISNQSGIDLKSLTTIASTAKRYTPDLLLKTFGTSVVGYVATNVVKVVPILGSIVGRALSYELCTNILSNILHEYTSVAHRMNEYVYEYLRGHKCDVKEFMARNNLPKGESIEISSDLIDGSTRQDCLAEMCDKASDLNV